MPTPRQLIKLAEIEHRPEVEELTYTEVDVPVWGLPDLALQGTCLIFTTKERWLAEAMGYVRWDQHPVGYRQNQMPSDLAGGIMSPDGYCFSNFQLSGVRIA